MVRLAGQLPAKTASRRAVCFRRCFTLRFPLLLLLLPGCLPAQELNLIPIPRQLVRGPGKLSLSSPVRITLATDSP